MVRGDGEAELHQVAIFRGHAGRVREQCRPAAIPPDQPPVRREHRDQRVAQASEHAVHARRDVVGDRGVLRRLQVLVQYTDAFTTYGPFGSHGPDPLRFYVPGAPGKVTGYMPGDRDKLVVRGMRRHAEPIGRPLGQVPLLGLSR